MISPRVAKEIADADRKYREAMKSAIQQMIDDEIERGTPLSSVHRFILGDINQVTGRLGERLHDLALAETSTRVSRKRRQG